MANWTIYRSRGEYDLFRELSMDELTSGAELEKETKTEKESASQAQVEGAARVELDQNERGQRMDGFGASFTDSSAYLIHRVLGEAEREELMVKLFDAQSGIGLSVLRNPMGASDYARSLYSYDDLPEGESDPSLAKFSIAHDEADVIPLTRRALELNRDLKLMASPWSAPGWMKTSGSLLGGRLKPEYYDAFAQYFVRYIQAYREHGLPIHAVTPQNEALYEPRHYPSMFMPADVQTAFIRDYLKPAFVQAGISAKILCYDHNWDRPDYPLEVLAGAGDAVDGVAWHWYGGNASAQSDVLQAVPGKEVHFTEGSGGEWIPAFEPAFSNVLRTGIEILRHNSQSFVLWNMALDEQNGPTVPGFGQSTCRGIVQVNQSTGALTYTLDYYALAHFSKIIRPGAVRIGSSCAQPEIRSAAFENTDGSIAVVLFNDAEEDRRITLRVPSEVLEVSEATEAAKTLEDAEATGAADAADHAVEFSFLLEAKAALSLLRRSR
ncbi:glycoside hydrolase family 30 protein [Saccharibacillus brassicae]|uniref:Glycosyl hydrolase n=1 Tax=Saccharibacillus brassicae TaxID=2583377 RepID=A0A4Y6UTL7_SACBS|nr:glycoside hydrolase family 30 beta sandwich domain-containing protein [Saccharibacillus brassicae]QDH19677.1 glycosyl hydrolase [Saccharibacillus brassicae]